MFCPNCGTKCEDSQKFCGKCGGALEGINTAPGSAPDSGAPTLQTNIVGGTVSAANLVRNNRNLKLQILKDGLREALPVSAAAAIYIETIPEGLCKKAIAEHCLQIRPDEVLALVDETNSGEADWLFTEDCLFTGSGALMPYSGKWQWKEPINGHDTSLLNKLFSDLYEANGHDKKYYSALDGLTYCFKMGYLKQVGDFDKLKENLKKVCDSSVHRACTELVEAIKCSGIVNTLKSSESADEIYHICYNNLYREIYNRTTLQKIYSNNTDAIIFLYTQIAGGKGERIRMLINQNSGQAMKRKVETTTNCSRSCLGCWAVFCIFIAVCLFLSGESLVYSIFWCIALALIGGGIDYLLHKKGKFIS